MKLEKIEGRGYRVGVPVPFPMKYIYCYLFKDEGHYVLVDVGFHYEEAKKCWQDVFVKIGIAPTDIKTIYLTHFHPDHSGLCGWMQELTGAKVFMHNTDKEMMEHVWGEGANQSTVLETMFIDYGVPKDLSEDVRIHMDKLAKHVHPLPTVQSIDEQISWNEQEWTVIHTPGHSGGHICFYQKEDKVLVAGDHILDKITPNISVWPRASQRPLHEYLDSLEKIKQYEVNYIYTAHGKMVTDLSKRADEIISHHHERLAKIEALSDGKTAYHVAEQLFAHKNLTPHQWRFAIAETIAHLFYLVEEGRVTKSTTKPHVFY
ncbi:MBL fold metallo-hydrolase [Alkalihalobacillus sp. 1P02AB]|uniref:MBL fold metallo-hydrolase n=1 Tax=Alkalihalobacillus sp. 1P02AB TaxID=3132260 RepID=UPI0039A75E81